MPAIVTHWERTGKPITRPLKVDGAPTSARHIHVSVIENAAAMQPAILD
ncbi:MAG: hypothetical protein JO170_08550 [Verrucomicrobia bacterium]|nr:hypothetical protein [Verrucomicrobiota bacterium]